MNGPGSPTDILIACIVGLVGGVLIHYGVRGLRR